MKILLAFLLSASASGDFGGPTCGKLKFRYGDVVEIINKDSFFYKCQGTVEARSVDCLYFVANICNGAEQDHFVDSDLKLLNKRGTINEL